MASYQYRPLDTASREIRLITLLPGALSDKLNIQLHHNVLDTSSPPQYEAVSYAWGSPENPASVGIREDGREAQSLFVTQNLVSALQHLRLEESARIL